MQAPHKQLEEILSQQVQIFYGDLLGHFPDKVVARLAEQQVFIVIENAMTQPEQILLASSKVGLAQEVRACLNAIMQPQIKTLIEEIAQSEISSLMMRTHLDRRETNIVAVFTTTMTEDHLAHAISHTATTNSGSNAAE